MGKFSLPLLWAAAALSLPLGTGGQARPFGERGAPLIAFQDPDSDSGAMEEPGEDYDVFYDRLSSDGTWFYDDDYGYIWQPNEAVSESSWRPYSDGHWVWTDRGWCWVSNENFGWATYHYGRWIRVSGTGWCWVPGDQWAPAWVSWRRTDDDDYVGWAPLPPEASVTVNVGVHSWCDNYYDIGPAAFAFIRSGDFWRPSYRGYIAAPQQNLTIINRTRNVTNITYNNNVIYNYGPQYERVSQIVQRQGQKVPNYKINYLSQAQPTASFGTQAQGNQLNVVGPPPKLKPVAAVQPQVTKQLGKGQVERGWQNVPQNQAQQLRGNFAKQAPPPPNALPPKPLPPPKPQIRNAKAQEGQPGKPGMAPSGPAGQQPATAGQPPRPSGQPPAPNEKLGGKTAAEQQKADALRMQNQQKKEPNQPPGQPPEQPKNAGPPNQKTEKASEQERAGNAEPPKPGEPVNKGLEAKKGTAEKTRDQRIEKTSPAAHPESQKPKGGPPNREEPNKGQTQVQAAHSEAQTGHHVEGTAKAHSQRASHPEHATQQPPAQKVHPQASDPPTRHAAPPPHSEPQHVAQAPHSQPPRPQPQHAAPGPRPPSHPQPQKAENKDKKKDHQD